jgi:hypothetical protein
VTARRSLLDVHHEPHFRMNGAENVEVAGYRKIDAGLAAWLLVA